ncbi:uncharacterized protein N0V96_008761 [Colletotrichum fioriniae]|uniref:uncharacterized protein n=1 Tax=Colletotrichum fioriniae TaxID=710243 RepID=UPI0032DB5746|nr:hypothetical protein N0V96_008761 [Colletotrichum fioriniae]
MIQGHLGQHESPEVPLNVDAEAFKLDWPSSRDIAPQATVDIPSLDYALYLTNTVKFHLGQTYHLFDEENFMTGLYDLYRTGPKLEPTADSRLWYIQFLIIMAFGKALLVPGNPNQTPPGSGLVTRALELLPDVNGLYQDPVLSQIGQAFRIAVSQGLHREPLKNLVSDSEANRLRCVWWTLYILDRKMSSLMGAPNSIQDSDITVQLPRSDPVVHKYKALGIHVVLSQLLAKVLNTRIFPPFDLEQAFSSAFVLTLMTSMPGLSERDNNYMQTTTDILDTMIARGNVVARCRKEELEKLQEMLCVAQRQLHAPLPVAGDGSSSMQATDQSSLRIHTGDALFMTEQPAEAGPATGSTTNGLASEQMLSIAGLLDWEPNMAAFDDDQLAGSWLWSEAIAPDFDFSGGLL